MSAHRWFARLGNDRFATCAVTQGTSLRVHMILTGRQCGSGLEGTLRISALHSPTPGNRPPLSAPPRRRFQYMLPSFLHESRFGCRFAEWHRPLASGALYNPSWSGQTRALASAPQKMRAFGTPDFCKGLQGYTQPKPQPLRRPALSQTPLCHSETSHAEFGRNKTNNRTDPRPAPRAEARLANPKSFRLINFQAARVY